MNIQEINLQQLKQVLEQQTNYEFEEIEWFDERRVLKMLGIPKTHEIKIGLGKYNTRDENNGTQFISFSYQEKYDGHFGCRRPCDTLEELIEIINKYHAKIGIKSKPKQLSLF